MRTIVEQWNSVDSYVEHIAASGTDRLGRCWSSLEKNESKGVSLHQFVSECRTLGASGYAQRVADIETLAADLLGSIPTGVSLKRQQVWKSSGHTVSVHRVLRGDLGHAWKKSIRRTVNTPGQGKIVFVMPCIVPWSISREQILWSTGATLALADHSRRTGRQVEIWACNWHERVFDSGHTYMAMVRLLEAGAPWNSAATVLSTYPEWTRRLGFRALEMRQKDVGNFFGGYGYAIATDQQLLSWIRDDWAVSQGLPAEIFRLGCTQWANVDTRNLARVWIESQISQVEESLKHG